MVIGYLLKSTKPTRISGLWSSIKSWFKPALNDSAVDAVVQSLRSSGKVGIVGTKVSYALD